MRVVRQIAETLAALHSRGIVHCDLSPSNIIVCPAGARAGQPRGAKIIDFAGARPWGAKTSASVTISRDMMSDDAPILGTPAYISPERLRGEDVTDKADVYSFGAILHELCTGRPPLPMAAIVKDLDSPPSIRLLVPALHPGLAALIDDMLAARPTDRPSMSDVARLLGSMPEDITVAPSDAPSIEKHFDPDAETFPGDPDTPARITD
jgi:serine/threonine-protein kinase